MKRLWLAIAGQMFWWKGKLSNKCVAIDLYLCNYVIYLTYIYSYDFPLGRLRDVSMLSPFPVIAANEDF